MKSMQRMRRSDSELRIKYFQEMYQSQVDSYKAPLLSVWEKLKKCKDDPIKEYKECLLNNTVQRYQHKDQPWSDSKVAWPLLPCLTLREKIDHHQRKTAQAKTCVEVHISPTCKIKTGSEHQVLSSTNYGLSEGKCMSSLPVPKPYQAESTTHFPLNLPIKTDFFFL